MRQNKICWQLIHRRRHQSDEGAAVVVRRCVLGQHQYHMVAGTLLVGQGWVARGVNLGCALDTVAWPFHVALHGYRIWI